jgi:hypothetical protein
VTYIGELGEEGEPQQRHDRLVKKLTYARNLHRPYLFKHFGFHLEQEVPFVIRTNPQAGSALIRIRARDFIRDFTLSDDIPEAEQVCIRDLAEQKLSEDLVVSGHSDADLLNPLSDANEPPGMFGDLD